MKIIGQYEKEEINNFLNGISNIDDYVQNKEVYSYFLHEIFEKDFIIYIKGKNLKLYQELNQAILNNQIYDRFHLYNKAKQEYVIQFNKERKKFYKFKGKIYSYLYMGDFNIGHIIEIYEYNNNDLVNVLNFHTSKNSNPNFWRKIFK